MADFYRQSLESARGESAGRPAFAPDLGGAISAVALAVRNTRADYERATP